MPTALDTCGSLHRMPFGAELLAGGGVRFRLWAPRHERIRVRIERARGPDSELPMQSEPQGWHTLLTDAAAAGSRYRFVLPDGIAVPDPASRFQPEDVQGPSEVIDPRSYRVARAATGAGGRGMRRWSMSCTSAPSRRPAPSAPRSSDSSIWCISGVTAIELMPIGGFSGTAQLGL